MNKIEILNSNPGCNSIACYVVFAIYCVIFGAVYAAIDAYSIMSIGQNSQ